MEYSFMYGNSDVYGTIKEEITEDEENLIIKAIRDSFDKLEDVDYLKSLRSRIFKDIALFEPVAEDDILWIYFPAVLVEKVMYGK